MNADKKGNIAKTNQREARLAAELRANLLRRKAQARQRKAPAKEPDADKKNE